MVGSGSSTGFGGILPPQGRVGQLEVLRERRVLIPARLRRSSWRSCQKFMLEIPPADDTFQFVNERSDERIPIILCEITEHLTKSLVALQLTDQFFQHCRPVLSFQLIFHLSPTFQQKIANWDFKSNRLKSTALLPFSSERRNASELNPRSPFSLKRRGS